MTIARARRLTSESGSGWAKDAKFILMICAALMLGSILAGCGKSSSFEGNITADAGRFEMDYMVLDREESSVLELAEADRLFVCVSQISGTLDVTVGIDGRAPIYEGRGLEDLRFVLNISEPGTYRITVSGHAACGRLEFTKRTAEG